MRKLKINSGTAGKYALVLVSVVLLASCRLIITTNNKGHIESASGLMDCGKAATCTFEIKESVTETFTAIPAQGFRFIYWRGACKNHPTNVCEVAISPLPEEYLEYDSDIGMKAVFESTNKTRPWFQDKDGDYFGNPTISKMSAERPKGFVVHKGDCDDTDPKIRPWIKEREDGRDTNCNGKVDEGFVDTELPLDQTDDGEIHETENRYYRDVDGDDYGRLADYVDSLEPIQGYVDNADDCDDNNENINPAAEELLDSIDNNCDGAVDEGFITHTYYRDIDGDGFGDRYDNIQTVIQPSGYVSRYPDNCIDISNPNQSDVDGDGIGDACDSFTDSDRDNVQDSVDNCPVRYNPGQDDVDGDGIGDSCDPVDDRPAPEPEPEPQPNVCTMTAEDQAMLDTVNNARSQTRDCGSQSYSAVPALSWNCNLEAAALGHSKDMADNNYFSHTGANGSSPGDRISQAGYSWSTYGENIAAGSGYSAASAVVQGWLGSPGHCSNIMGGNFTNLGAAKYSNPSSTYGLYWTQVFGRSR